MIQAVNITKRYEKKIAVDDVSFELTEGSITGLIGHNGAGKTTTIRMLLGLLPPDSGRIFVKNGISTKIGYIPEEKGLYKNASAYENIAYLASLKGVRHIELQAKVAVLLQKLGIDDFTRKKVHTLSKGYQQITQIIAGIIHNPEIILFDEPYGGLDPLMQDAFTNMITRMAGAGHTILISTHLLEKAEAVCNRLLLMNQGKLLFDGNTDSLSRKTSSIQATVMIDGIVEQHSFASDRICNEFLAAHPQARIQNIELIENSNRAEILSMLSHANNSGAADA